MKAASDALEFERAARLRDDLAALRRAMEKQTVVFADGTDADVVAFAEDELQAAVQVFHVRGGRVRGQRGWVVEKTEQLTTGDLVEHFCSQVYGGEAESGERDLPREILVPALPSDVDSLAAWLSQLRGGRVTIRVPQRGDKKTLLETVARNAAEALTQHKLRRAADLTARGRALEEIAEALGLGAAPLRIECYDVSQIHGTDVVASMVVFEDGLARKSEYRRFIVGRATNTGATNTGATDTEATDTGGTDDVSAISEVLRRRFARYLAARQAGELTDSVAPAIDPETGKARKFAYPPNLVVVDGGAPQVNAAAAVLRELGITDVAVCGLAKRLEEVWLPDDPFPVVLPRASEGLYLLQRVRDEAHRFAITFHRQRRSKRMTKSTLDNVPGLGEVRRKALLRHFGSVKRLASATVEEIMEVPGIGRRTAESILAALAPRPEPAATAPTAQPDSGAGAGIERAASPTDAAGAPDDAAGAPEDGGGERENPPTPEKLAPAT
jgi:excinuclease ABC subunit C